MAKVRMQRVSEQMKHVAGMVITQELKDPRAGFITIINAVVAPDLKTARIDYSVLGTDSQKRTASRALDSARGYIQARIADEMLLKYTPVITFRLDESIELDIAMQHKIAEAIESDKRAAGARDIRAKIAAGTIPSEKIDALVAAAESPDFTKYISEALAALSVKAGSAAETESKMFDEIEKRFAEFKADAAPERISFDPEINTDPDYLAGEQEKSGTPSKDIYAERANLNVIVPGTNENAPQRLILHANVETPEQATTIIAAFRLATVTGKLPGSSCAQFAIEAPDTGNGTLCLALQDVFPYTGLVLLRQTGQRICIAAKQTETGPVALREADAPLDVYMLESAKRLGMALAPPEPCVSRDTYIFQNLFRDRDVIAFGAGSTGQPATENEIAQAAKILAVLILEYAGPYA